MLHILWMILKFILILLGTVLGLVVLLLLLILFCPVCYRISVSKEAEESLTQMQVNGRVSWLFRGISLKISYKKGNLEHDIFLFGIPLGKIFSRLRRRKTDRTLKKTEVPEEPLQRDVSSKKETGPEIKRETEVLFKQEEVSESEDDLERELEDWLKAEPEPQVQKVKNISPESRKKVTKEKASETKSTPRSERAPREESAKRKISLTFRNICDKIKQQKAFFSDQRTKDALSLVWSDAKGLIIHILPVRIEGHVTFGCKDPSITGTILAILGIFVPFHKNKISVNPLFEDKNILEGQIKAKGRIFVCVLVKIAIEIYFNKNVKYIINQWKHKEG